MDGFVGFFVFVFYVRDKDNYGVFFVFVDGFVSFFCLFEGKLLVGVVIVFVLGYLE